MGRRHRRSKVTRVVNLVKRIVAFFLSHVGLCGLVIGYALLGAVVFRAVEGPFESFIQREVTNARSHSVGACPEGTEGTEGTQSAQSTRFRSTSPGTLPSG